MLPVPSCRLAGLRPFVPVLEINAADITAIVRLNVAILAIHPLAHQIASRGIELEDLVKEEPGVSAVFAGPRI